ncbi:MAG: hypothetical protein K2Q15_04655 [Burkholderiales bacterium]|nr:hypothetical protein [Burkholderiales bacterium]
MTHFPPLHADETRPVTPLTLDTTSITELEDMQTKMKQRFVKGNIPSENDFAKLIDLVFDIRKTLPYLNKHIAQLDQLEQHLDQSIEQGHHIETRLAQLAERMHLLENPEPAVIEAAPLAIEPTPAPTEPALADTPEAELITPLIEEPSPALAENSDAEFTPAIEIAAEPAPEISAETLTPPESAPSSSPLRKLLGALGSRKEKKRG